jgi:hypothetical protein
MANYCFKSLHTLPIYPHAYLTCLWNLESKHVMHEVDHPLHNTLQEDIVLQIDQVTIYRNTIASSPLGEFFL